MEVTVSSALDISSRDYGSIDPVSLERITLFVLEQEGAPEASEVSITLVDTEHIAHLNNQYRGKEGPTDVLSFECDDPHDAPLVQEDGSALLMLGDVIIAPEIARLQASEYDATFQEEMDLLVVHGVLHLLGYDHIDDEEARVMEEREEALLKAWWGRSE